MMHLLDTTTLELKQFSGASIPAYAILSHTWADEEVSFDQIGNERCQHLAGYAKLKR